MYTYNENLNKLCMNETLYSSFDRVVFFPTLL